MAEQSAKNCFVSLPITMTMTRETKPTTPFSFIKYAKPVIFSGLLFFAVTMAAQPRAFIKKFSPLADSLSAAYGIPVSIILGVSIIESGSGTSRNCRLLNNYFGIVGKNNLLKTKGIKSMFKQYPDATACFIDFCNMLARKKYYTKLKGKKDSKLWIDAMSKAGYSEQPDVWRREVTKAVRQYFP
jgi:Bax protein